MNEIAREICARLDEMGVRWTALEHAPVEGIEDCAPIGRALDALVPKNYFLTPRRQARAFLCLTRPEARFRTADISRQAGSSRLSFGSEAALWAALRTRPGAVSPLGLIFDEAASVELLVDAGLRDFARLAFHPCDASCTVAMSAQDFFERFLPAVGRAPRWVEIHDFLQ